MNTDWLGEKTVTRIDGLLLAGLLLAFAVARASGLVAWWTSIVIAAAVFVVSGLRLLHLFKIVK